MASTIVLQSFKQPISNTWVEKCIHSVKSWSEINHYDYQFIGDELFDSLSPELFEKIKSQIVVATDLARLKLLQNYLTKNYETVIWCDADFLIFCPQSFKLPNYDYAFGREVWIQHESQDSNKLVSKIKIHNAFMMFRLNNAFLDFYAETAEKLLRLNTGSIPPQFIGPKFLSAIHNIVLSSVTDLGSN